MSQLAAVSKVAETRAIQARNVELASQLRAAAAAGDDARINRLLAELLRCKGLSRGQRIALQQRALTSLVQSLRSAALNDDLSGLHNRRGFVQTATRVLDLAAREGEEAHLVYFAVDPLERVTEALGSAAAEMLVRQMGNLLRDLFPSYGVREVLGRIAGDEFAALTTRDAFATRAEVLEQLARLQNAAGPALTLSLGVAHFDPDAPVSIDVLLEEGRRLMNQPESHLAAAVPMTHLGPRALAAFRA
ncbi:MAG: diguanylate cyclase [Proteobacteria bacterium]|nr:diguanylate cyclase [Pseudomonadota bacterium]